MSGSSSLLSKKKKQVLALTRGNICLTSKIVFAIERWIFQYLYTCIHHNVFVSLYVICACVLRILTNVCYTSTRWLGWKLDICPRWNICPSTLSESESLLKWAKLICHRYKTCHSGSFFWDLKRDTISVVDTK